MIEAFVYWLMQSLGYRLLCFDKALQMGLPLDHYQGWFWYPKWKKGTHREVKIGGECYLWAGYGIDK